MTTVCCVCQRIKSGRKWVGKGETADEGRISHGYCPECYRAAMARLRHVIRTRQFRPVASAAGL